MTFSAILLLAVGLAMDAMAVSAARGLAVPKVRRSHVVSVALFFGGFQALMPCVGWLIGASVGPLVQAWDHWVAFGLLGAIGTKMLLDARSGDAAEPRTEGDPFAPAVMLVLAVATSIDALAVGVTLPMLNAPLLLAVVTIGVTAGGLSALGLFAGRRFGAAVGSRLDALGGLVLIALGTKILIEHLVAS